MHIVPKHSYITNFEPYVVYWGPPKWNTEQSWWVSPKVADSLQMLPIYGDVHHHTSPYMDLSTGGYKTCFVHVIHILINVFWALSNDIRVLQWPQNWAYAPVTASSGVQVLKSMYWICSHGLPQYTLTRSRGVDNRRSGHYALTTPSQNSKGR
jgi:hypothetical protein